MSEPDGPWATQGRATRSADSRAPSLPPTETLPVYGESAPRPQSQDWRSKLSRAAVRYDPAAMQTDKVRGRSRLLTLMATPLLLGFLTSLISGNGGAALANLIFFTLIAFGASMIRQGQEAAEAYERRAFAAPPALPRKLIGSLMAGLGLGLAAGWGWLGIVPGAILGLVSAGLAVAAFGMDPMARKGDPAAAGVSHEDLQAIMAETNGRLEELDSIGERLRDPSLGAALREITDATRKITDRIERDPNDLRRSRKFLKVYLDGVLESSRKYERAQESVDPATEWKFRKLLRDMKTVAEEQYAKLLNDDKTDLDVEIEVLADRLKTEAGV